MRDDFSALDLFIATDAKPGKRKKKTKKQPLAAFQPLIAKIKKKQKSDAVDAASLQGWGVSLSWAAPSPKAGNDAEQAYPLTYSS